MKRKLLVLGGGENQLPLIKSAKNEGYYVILCDFRNNVPGIYLSDIYYQIDVLNYEAVLDIARKESIDGVVSNSEPVMSIVAKLSSELKLIGTTEQSVENLTSKYKFRTLQKQIGLYSPISYCVSNENLLHDVLNGICYPIIIKPCKSSGSRGTTYVDKFDKDKVYKAFNICSSYSRDKNVVIEEYVPMPSLTTIEGDIFIYKDKIIWDGLFFTTRSKYAPLVPMTYTAPLWINEQCKEKIKRTISSILYAANITFGEYNIEGYFNKSGDFFIVEINPRQGGHEIPYFIEQYSGIDLNRLLVTLSVGDESYYHSIVNRENVCKYVIKQTSFSYETGIYNGIYIDDIIKSNVVRINEIKQIGDKVEKCIDGTSLVAIIDLVFNSEAEQKQVFENMDSLIRINVVK